ncbi:unnamed protein product [Cochlearia groenlandica]
MSSSISGNKNLARRFSPTPPLRSNTTSSSEYSMALIEATTGEQEVEIEASFRVEASKSQSEVRGNIVDVETDAQAAQIQSEMNLIHAHASTEKKDEKSSGVEEKQGTCRGGFINIISAEEPKAEMKKRKPRVPEATGSSEHLRTQLLIRGTYDKKLVCECWAHLPTVKVDEEYFRVWVRDVYYDLSPDATNSTLRAPTLTNDERHEYLKCTTGLTDKDMVEFLTSKGTLLSRL